MKTTFKDDWYVCLKNVFAMGKKFQVVWRRGEGGRPKIFSFPDSYMPKVCVLKIKKTLLEMTVVFFNMFAYIFLWVHFEPIVI